MNLRIFARKYKHKIRQMNLTVHYSVHRNHIEWLCGITLAASKLHQLRTMTLRCHINSVPWLYAVTTTPYHECTQFVDSVKPLSFSLNRGFLDQLRTFMVQSGVWPRKVTLRSWCDRVNSRYGVVSIPQSHSKWFLCTLYTAQWHSFGEFYVSFVHSTEFSASMEYRRETI